MCASYYYNFAELVCYAYSVYNPYCYSESLLYVILMLFGIHLQRCIIFYCISMYKEYVILLCCICNHHKTLHSSRILNQFLCDIFGTQLFSADKYIHNLPKASITDNQQTLKDTTLVRSNDFGERYRGSDLNCLSSVILRQYTTLTNQC